MAASPSLSQVPAAAEHEHRAVCAQVHEMAGASAYAHAKKEEVKVAEEAAAAEEAARSRDEECELVAELFVSEIIDRLVMMEVLEEEEPDWLKEAAEHISLSGNPVDAAEAQPPQPPQTPVLSSDGGGAADAEIDHANATPSVETPPARSKPAVARSPSSFSPSNLSPAVKRGAVTGLLAAGTAVLFTIAAKRR